MDTEKTPEEIRDYMNRYLPDDICVQEAKLAADRFHARYRAVGKLYTYTCYVGNTKPVFNRKYVTVLDYQPDLAAMQRAAEILRILAVVGKAFSCGGVFRGRGGMQGPDEIPGGGRQRRPGR